MKKLLLAITLLVVVSASGTAAAQNKNAVAGSWKYEVAQAPYGYEKGNIVITAQKNLFSGDVNFDSGYSVKLQDVTWKNDTLRANASVEGESINIVAKVVKNNMTGTVDTSMGKMELKAEKIEKK